METAYFFVFFVVLERRYDQNEKGQPFRGAPPPPPVQHQGLSSVGSTELAVSLGLSVFCRRVIFIRSHSIVDVICFAIAMVFDSDKLDWSRLCCWAFAFTA